MSAFNDATTPLADIVPQSALALSDKWTDAYALQIVRSDFAYAESYRTMAHDWRYRNASELYLAWVPQRYWEGTRVPRSSLGIYTVFEQAESMLPKIVQAICDEEAYNFYPLYSNEYDHALAWKRLVLEQLDEIHWREHIRRCAKSSLIYGNGILEAGVEDYSEETIEFNESHHIAELQMVQHPLLGNVPFPKRIETRYNRHIQKKKKVRPYLRYVSLIDMYVDPNCESTQIQDAGHVCKRVYKTVADLRNLRGSKNFNIPSDTELQQLSRARTSANQDVTKSASEAYRYNMWNPAQDYTSDPLQKRIEVIEYTTKDRKVWMLNRDLVAYNQPNRYGKINFYGMHYADVLDRWHALSISDIGEGEQKLQCAIINARVDELALSIHRPMVKRRSVTVPQYQLKIRPGLVLESENPDGDFKQLEVQNITQQAFIEVAASRSRLQGTTGITDLAAVGVPSSGGNSANRTATGVNTQSAATQDRMRYYVENAETLCMEPLLNDWIMYDKKFLDPQEAAGWLRADPAFKNVDPLDVMNCQLKVECRASIKMAGRLAFLQTLPVMFQTVLNPAYLEMLARVNRVTLNPMSLERTVWDAINYTPREPMFRDMTQEEVQQMMTPPPDVQARMQIAGDQNKTKTDIHNKQNMTKFMVQFMKDSFKHGTELAKLDDAHIHALLDAALRVHEADQSQHEPAGGE